MLLEYGELNKTDGIGEIDWNRMIFYQQVYHIEMKMILDEIN